MILGYFLIFYILKCFLSAKIKKKQFLPSNQVSQVSQVIQLPLPDLKVEISNKFISTDLLGEDVAVSPDGDIYIVGIDGKLYTYNFATASYNRIIADPDVDDITRVTVDGSGTPYIVTGCGATYYLSCDGRWIQLPGCAKDIAVGVCGDVWKIGCDERQGGFGVYKLFCSSQINERTCDRFRQFNYGNKYKSKILKRPKCNWNKISGAGVRIDVFPDGRPAVVQDNGVLLVYDGREWDILTQYAGRDISISNNGNAFVSGLAGGMYIISKASRGEGFFDERYGIRSSLALSEDSKENYDSETRYVDIGCTQSIGVGPFGQPAMIPCRDQYEPIVVLSQKLRFN